MKMRLSSLEKIGSFKTVRDASFDTPRFVSDPRENMLTFFESSRYEGLIGDVKGIAVAEDPRLAFHKIHNYLAREHFYWKDFPTQIAGTAKVHPKASIAEKNVRI